MSLVELAGCQSAASICILGLVLTNIEAPANNRIKAIEVNRTFSFMFTPMRCGREEIDVTLLPSQRSVNVCKGPPARIS
jgi:hypothetical protein